MNIQIQHGDCRELLPNLPDESVHLVVTDPPYFLDGLDTDWDKGKVIKVGKGQAVRNLHIGMNFDCRQGLALQEFMHGISQELFRILKPGAIALFFSQCRLSHRMAVGVEDAGFEIRDMPVWHYRNKAQFKAFSMDHFVRKMDLPESEQQEIINDMANRRTIQLRPQIESVILAQKPKQGTHVENWMQHRTGLMDISRTSTGKAPTTLMEFEKEPRDDGNSHPTVKPVELICELIRLFSAEGQTVLDPFLGSGTTAVAATLENRKCIGMEVNPEYVRIIENRLHAVDKSGETDDNDGMNSLLKRK